MQRSRLVARPSARHSLLLPFILLSLSAAPGLSLFQIVSQSWKPEEREWPLWHKSSFRRFVVVAAAAAMNIGRHQSSEWQALSAADVAVLALELVCIGLWVAIIFLYHLLRCVHRHRLAGKLML